MPGMPEEFFSEQFDFFTSECFGALAEANSSPFSPDLDEKKLQEYLEAVEETLFKQVRARSAQFFQALALFHNLKKGVTDTCESITALRQNLAVMDDSCVKKALEITQSHTRKCNMLALQELVESVAQAVPSPLSFLRHLQNPDILPSTRPPSKAPAPTALSSPAVSILIGRFTCGCASRFCQKAADSITRGRKRSGYHYTGCGGRCHIVYIRWPEIQ